MEESQVGDKRRKHSDKFKARVALEAVKGVRTLSELSSAYGVHPTVIAQWKKQLVERAPEVFRRGNGTGFQNEEELTAPLYEEIGRLKMERDWLKKKALSLPLEERRRWVDPENTDFPVTRQCELAGIPRSSYYYEPAGGESEENLRLMCLLDKMYPPAAGRFTGRLG